MCAHEETCQLGPTRRVIKLFQFRVRNGGWESQENPGLAHLARICFHKREEELVAKFDGLEEFFGLLAADKLDVLLEPELKLK